MPDFSKVIAENGTADVRHQLYLAGADFDFTEDQFYDGALKHLAPSTRDFYQFAGIVCEALCSLYRQRRHPATGPGGRLLTAREQPPPTPVGYSVLNRFLSEARKISEVNRLAVEAVLIGIPRGEFACAVSIALEEVAYGPLASHSWQAFQAAMQASRQSNVAIEKRPCTLSELRGFVKKAFENGMSLRDTVDSFHIVFAAVGVDHIIEGVYTELVAAKQEIEDAMSGKLFARMESYFGFGGNTASYRPVIVLPAIEPSVEDKVAAPTEEHVEPATGLEQTREPVGEPVKKILTLAARPEGVTVRDLKRTTAAWQRDPEGLTSALDMLVATGRLTSEVKADESGGRPTTVYRLGAN